MQAGPLFFPALRQLRQGPSTLSPLRSLSSLHAIPAKTQASEHAKYADLQVTGAKYERIRQEDNGVDGRFGVREVLLDQELEEARFSRTGQELEKGRFSGTGQELEAGQSSPGAVAVPAELSEAISKAVAGESW